MIVLALMEQLLGNEALQRMLAVPDNLCHLVRHWVEKVCRYLRVLGLCMRSGYSHKRRARPHTLRAHRVKLKANERALSLTPIRACQRCHLPSLSFRHCHQLCARLLEVQVDRAFQIVLRVCH